jgi:oligoribonuclease NrnB/cAMP/cGMP phosphodiesterase (DHH superfamily)
MKYIVVTHRDLDGIAGASLYVYCRKLTEDKLKLVFIEPSDLLKILRRYYKLGRHFVIIDVGLNNDAYNELKDIDLSGVHIEWYDHHVWDQEWVNVLREKGVYLNIDRSTCATGVVAKNVCIEDQNKVKQLIDIVCDADLWRFNRYESTFLFRYTDLGNSGSWRIKVFNTIKAFLEGVVEDIVSTIEEDVSRYVDEELKVLSEMRNEIIQKVVDGMKVCIYFKKRSIPSTSIIGNAMLSICDIAIVVHESLRSLSFRSRRCNVREIAKLFNGGGHPRAAGAPLEIPLVYKVLNSIGIDLAKKRIVEDVFDKIERFRQDLKNMCSAE